jgi:hypothetical protein
MLPFNGSLAVRIARNPERVPFGGLNAINVGFGDLVNQLNQNTDKEGDDENEKENNLKTPAIRKRKRNNTELTIPPPAPGPPPRVSFPIDYDQIGHDFSGPGFTSIDSDDEDEDGPPFDSDYNEMEWEGDDNDLGVVENSETGCVEASKKQQLEREADETDRIIDGMLLGLVDDIEICNDGDGYNGDGDIDNDDDEGIWTKAIL